MKLMGLPFTAERSGDEYGVSYVLRVNEKGTTLGGTQITYWKRTMWV